MKGSQPRWRVCGAVCALAAAGAMILANSASSTGVQNSPPRKMVEFGWDLPTPDVLRNRLAAMTSHPFDGVVLKLHVGPAILTSRPYPTEAFAQDLDDLKSFHSDRLRENFLLVWVTREKDWDWFSDSDWAAAEANVRNFARLARTGGLRGILLDTEAYGPEPWDYRRQLHHDERSYSMYEQKVAARGAQFMRALLTELPDAKVLLTWGPASLALYSTSRLRGLGRLADLQNHPFGLLLAFMDGAGRELRGGAQIIDGNELSYYYLSEGDFAYTDSLRAALIVHCNSGGAGTCTTPVRLGQSVYVDWIVAPTPSPRNFGFYMPSMADRLKLLEQNVYQALRATDEYVWVYSERMNWWTGKLPPGVAQAVQKGRDDFFAGTPPDSDVTESVRTARKAYDARVTIEGKVVSGTVGVSGVIMRGMEDVCYPTDDSGKFYCVVPADWSGRLQPTHGTAAFSPSERTFQKVTSAQRQQDFAMN